MIVSKTEIRINPWLKWTIEHIPQKKPQNLSYQIEQNPQKIHIYRKRKGGKYLQRRKSRRERIKNWNQDKNPWLKNWAHPANETPKSQLPNWAKPTKNTNIQRKGGKTYRDVRAGGDDGHGVGLGVKESGDAEVRGQAQASLAGWDEGVYYVHYFAPISHHVLCVRFSVLCFEPLLLLVPHYLLRLLPSASSCCHLPLSLARSRSKSVPKLFCRRGAILFFS